jgi:hypothetical protein
MGTHNHPTSVYCVAGIIGTSHHAWPGAGLLNWPLRLEPMLTNVPSLTPLALRKVSSLQHLSQYMCQHNNLLFHFFPRERYYLEFSLYHFHTHYIFS